MKLTLKLHQLIQAIAFVGNDDIACLELDVTIKELEDGLYVWRTADPSKSYKLSAVAPTILEHEPYESNVGMEITESADDEQLLEFMEAVTGHRPDACLFP
jgi:hypothetical protein